MNSLPDVEEVQSMTNKKGVNAYRVYRFLDEKPRKSTQKNKPGNFPSFYRAVDVGMIGVGGEGGGWTWRSVFMKVAQNTLSCCV